MICSTCNGTGSLFNTHAGAREWWSCPACAGAGVRAMSGSARVLVKSRGFIHPGRLALQPAGETDAE